MYGDADELYGWAMVQQLASKSCQLNSTIALVEIYDNHICYHVGCDWECPEHLYDKFKELPPCPESLSRNWMVVRYSKIYNAEEYYKTKKCAKVIPQHERHVIHCRVKTTQLHRIIWLKPYLEETRCLGTPPLN